MVWVRAHAGQHNFIKHFVLFCFCICEENSFAATRCMASILSAHRRKRAKIDWNNVINSGIQCILLLQVKKKEEEKRSSSPFLNGGYWYGDHMHVDLRECSSRKPFVCIQMMVILFLFSLSLSFTYLFFVAAAAFFFKYIEKEYKSKMLVVVKCRF